MAFQHWQIGLDIQNGQLCALAVERRRHGWQLRHWWQQPLPHDTLRNGVLQTSAVLQEMLTRWQRQLPKRYSLRVGLPPQLVLQRTLPLPAPALCEPALSRYVAASASRLFPVEAASLALDYRPADTPDKLSVTAARREAISQWLLPLQQAGLQPEVFELSSLALLQVALQMALRPASLLVHPLQTHWLWAMTGEATACGTSAEPLSVAHLHATFPQADTLYCTSPPPLPEADVQLLQPFSLLRYQQPPLPAQPGAFAVALGLALRPEDC